MNAVQGEPAQLAYERDVLGFVPDAIAGHEHPESGVAAIHSEQVSAQPRHAYDDYHVLTLQLGANRLFQLDRNGRGRGHMRAGTIAIQPVDADTVWQSDGRTRWMQFYLPTRVVSDCIVSRGLDPERVRLERHAAVDDPALVNLLYRCAAATATALRPTHEELDALSTNVADVLVARYSSAALLPLPAPDRERLSTLQLGQATEYISTHLGPGLTATRVAAELGLSRFHFTRAFRGATGQSPYRYIQQRRLAAARDEVVASESSLADIAYDLGFASQAHMTSAFKSALGVPPCQVRALARGRPPRTRFVAGLLAAHEHP
jgi:AraC family transcriptional regulator